jgi:predicted Holliday junction resolvase-like endonuclease
MYVLNKACIAFFMILVVLVVIMYFYISKLQDENKALELSNSSLSVTLKAQNQEFLNNQKTISELNSKLNSLRAKSRNEEDKLNEAISKSNDNCHTVKLNNDILDKLR